MTNPENAIRADRETAQRIHDLVQTWNRDPREAGPLLDELLHTAEDSIALIVTLAQVAVAPMRLLVETVGGDVTLYAAEWPTTPTPEMITAQVMTRFVNADRESGMRLAVEAVQRGPKFAWDVIALLLGQCDGMTMIEVRHV